jgi:hypothetical protein
MGHALVELYLKTVIQQFLSTPEVRVCKHKGGWDHECLGCLEDANTLATLHNLQEKFKNL